MQTILITGAGPNGVTGRRIKEMLEQKYNILSPSSKELDLTDSHAVDDYFKKHNIDYVVHSALTSPSRRHDDTRTEDEVESNLRMYFNLAKHADEFKKMFYFGSGAEYDKRREIVDVSEEDSGSNVPADKYGFVKYILNTHSKSSENIYNLRLFGTINPYEPPTKNVISNLCAKAVLGEPLKLRRNCRFSFVDIDDVAAFIDYGINHDLQYNEYNMSGGQYSLKEIGDIINSEYCCGNSPLTFENPGMNLEYTASNSRLKKAITNTDVIVSLSKIIKYMQSIKDKIDTRSIDSRWNNLNTNQGGGNQ